jgi:[ribosomal protein S5]-alanine N-acetyltransferase
MNNSSFDKFPLLSTSRLQLRSFCRNDASFLYEIRSNKEIAESMGVKRHSTVSETESFINDIDWSFKAKTGINWVICLKDKNRAIGYAGVWKIAAEHCKGEIGYALNSNYCGNGYMIEALNRLIDFSFNELELHRLEANVDSQNYSSIKLLKKLNFKQEAVLRDDYFLNGKFHSSMIFSKLDND